MEYKVTEENIRDICTPELLSKLKKAGIKTYGYSHHLEEILKERGFGVPIPDDDYFMFMVKHKYIRYYLNYADALAAEILLLIDLKLMVS